MKTNLQKISIVFWAILWGVAMFSSAQTVLSIGGASGAPGDSVYQINIRISNLSELAGLQFDLADSWSAVRIDSVMTGERTSGFFAMQHLNRVLLYHPEGVSLVAGEGEILRLSLHLSADSAGIDSLFFASPPILSDRTP